MGLHDWLGPDRGIACSQLDEQLAIEHHRMTVSIAIDRPDYGRRGMAPVRVEHRAYGAAGDERQIDERYQYTAYSRTICRTQSGLKR
jgi:hypothetical protein